MDFYGFYVRKGETPNDVIHFAYQDFESREVFYGRKSWELVYALDCDTNNDCMSQLTLDAWIDLQEKLSTVGPFLDRIGQAFYVEDDYQTAEDIWYIKQYMRWYDQNFDTAPHLGYDFSVGYMRTFWEAADNVIEYLEDPDYEVWMLASY